MKTLKVVTDLGFGSYQTNEGEFLWDGGIDGEGGVLIGHNKNYNIVSMVRDREGKIVRFEVDEV